MKSRAAKSWNHAPMHSRLHFLTNFHFQLNWYFSSIKWPPLSYNIEEYVIVWGCAAAKRQKTTKTHVQTKFWVSHRLFMSLTDYCLLIPTPIHWHTCSCRTFCQFTTMIVNLSFPKLLEHLHFLSWNIVQKGEEWLHSSLMHAHETDSKWQCSQLSS